MSRAIVFNRYGGPEVLEVMQVELPTPASGQVRVRVKAAGVQPFDCFFRSGQAHQWMPARFPQRMGNEFAGVIEAIGDNVGTYRVGDEILGWAMRTSHAEHVLSGEEGIVRKPAGMGWNEAGTLSCSGQTAATALRLLQVKQGETLLIHAAAGGVGSFAVQLAVARGARVIGTASVCNHEYLGALGATPVAYGDGLADRIKKVSPDGVDAALDASGTLEALHVSVETVADRRRIGTVAYQRGIERLGTRNLTTEQSSAQLRELAALYSAGKLRVSIQSTYPLEYAADAHRALETRHVRGKVVLTP